jgi:hypothetical protein
MEEMNEGGTAVLSPQLYKAITTVVDDRVKDIRVTREDFNELRAIVAELASAQAKTEERMGRLEEAVERLAQAQAKTEERVGGLEEAVERLAQAQVRTEERVGSLERAVEALAEAQKRTEESVTELVQVQKDFAITFDMKIGALGGRWGLSSEEAFRRGMDHILKEVGFKAERFLGYDKKGDVFGHPDQVEMDVIVRDSRIIAVEIKSSVDRNDVATFNRKVIFYEQETGQKVSEKIFISPFVDPSGTEKLAQAFEIMICTDPKKLRI